MKSRVGFNAVVVLLFIYIILLIWVFGTSGDTPILPAVALLFPWGIGWGYGQTIFPVSINIIINTVFIYLIFWALEKLLMHYKR